MDLSDAVSRHERGNAILFTRDSPCLSALRSLLESSDRRTVALWGLERAERTAEELARRHPEDPRPSVAVETCSRWCRGEIKMPEAKRAILDVHAMARDMRSPADAALCHAVGQGCSCVHTPKHALGLPVYELPRCSWREGRAAQGRSHGGRRRIWSTSSASGMRRRMGCSGRPFSNDMDTMGDLSSSCNF